MLKLNKEILNRLYMADLRAKYPTFPQHAMPEPKYSDTTANGLTKCIKEFLNFTGHQAERIASGGRVIDGRKTTTDVIGRTVMVGSTRYISGTSTNGTADISATIFGVSVKIEVKIGADKQSETQRIYQRNIEEAGGIYLIAKTFDGFIEDYRKLITNGRLINISPLGREFIVANRQQCKIQYLDNLEVKIITPNQIAQYL